MSSTATEVSASQIVSQSTPSSPTPASTRFPISHLKSSSTTQLNQVQPPASFARASRQFENGTLRPRPSSFASTSSGVHQRFMDAVGGSLTRQLSIASASDVSSIAMRRMPQVGAKHSREPLLPISIVPKVPADASAPDPPSSPGVSTNTKTVRNSLERIFKRGTSADTIPASLKASPRHSPLQPKSPLTELEMQQPHSPSAVNDSYFPTQPPSRPPPVSTTMPHEPGFSPLPPPNTTPFVPYVSTKTGKPERNYVDYPSQNTFFLRGHLLTGGDSPLPFIGSFVLVLGIAGTWFATTCVWWWHNESASVAAVGAYMCLITVASMLATVSDHTILRAVSHMCTGSQRPGDPSSEFGS